MKLLLLASAFLAVSAARPSPALVQGIHTPAQANYPHYERVQPRLVHHDAEGYGRSHMWVDEGAAKALGPHIAGLTKHTMMGYWWNFAHPNATKDESTHKACDCRPGYHNALDVKCHVDAFGHLRVTHPEMACSGDKYRADKHRWHYKAPNSPNSGEGPYGNEAGKPDRCLKRHWTGTHGVTHHRCAFLTKTTCACCDCKNGKHHLCPAGKHRHVGSGGCLDCVKGRFTDRPNDLARCEDCPGGRFTAQLASITCKQCERGQYQPDPEQTKCKNCASGRYTPNRGRLGCDNCNSGQHQLFTGKDHCNDCAAGHYAPQPGTVGCPACPVETWQPYEGKDHCLPVEVCDDNEYETKEYTATSDRTCGTHTVCNSKRQYITKPAGSHHDRECGRCTPGYWCNGVSRTKCAKGKFQTGQPDEKFPDLSFCPLCAKGTYTGGTGWTQCKNCPKGFFQRNEGHSGCKQCFAGTYADVTGLIECKSCQRGKFASDRGLVTCTKCYKGQYQGTEGASACLDCAAGQIASTTGLKQCADCGNELWQDVEGMAACKHTTKCAANEYETEAYTTSTNRVCRAHHTCNFPSAPHQAGEYVTKRPGTHHDRVCASLNECDYTTEPGQYESTLAGTHRQRQCTDVIRCGKGQYMLHDKTYTSQRECAACSGDTTQLSTSHIATVCPARATCGKGQRVLSHGSTSVQRTCTACVGDTYRADVNHVQDVCLDRRECQAGTRMLHDGSFTKDRTCVACQGDTWRDELSHRYSTCKHRTLCQPGQYMTDNGSFTKDRTCTSCPGDTYQDAADHTLTSCKPRALCGKGEYMDNTGGTEDTGGWRRANNRVCKPCSGDTFQARPAHTLRACDDRQECTKGQRMAHDGSFVQDRACVACHGDTFKAKASHRDTACEARKLCQRGQRMSHDGSHELDRTCVSCGHPSATDTFQKRSNHKLTTCDARSKCGPGYYMNFDGSYVADRTCVSCAGDTFKSETQHTHTACDARTTCDWVNEWMEHDGHLSKDRVCTALTVCTDHEYETKPKTRTSDRTCATIDKCDWPHQWESKAPTYSSDRECTIVRKCTTTQWQRHAPTRTSNRVCVPHTRCHNKAFGQAEDSEWQSKPAGTHHDRECKSITACTSTQWQAAQYTTTSDRDCKDCSTEPACPWNQYRWTLREQQQGLTRPGLSTNEICGGVSAGLCVYDCHDRFPWATTNCFVGRSGTPWFAATTQWSQHAFPEWPEHASTRFAVDLERHARGAAKGVTVHRGGKIVIKKNGGELQIGLTTCHAHEWEHTAPTLSGDRVCEHAGACANGELIKPADRRQRHHCGSCDAGYHLMGRTCVPWGGTCSNGHMPSQAERVQENQCATCKPGHGFDAATKTCSQCTVGTDFSGTTDAYPCSPVDAGLTCAAGHGFVHATATSDHRCEACDGVFTYSDVNDRSACKNIDRVLTCVAGQGFVSATARHDATCAPCNGKTKFSSATDQRPCQNVNTGLTCPSGQGFVPSTPSTDTSCVTCDGTSQYNGAVDQSPCRDVNDSLMCPPGQGFVSATAHEDHSCEPCDGMNTFSDSTDGTACQPVNSVLTCGPGYGFIPATPSTDNTCQACVLKVTFSDSTDNSACSAADTGRACAAGLGFVASTLTENSKCVQCDGTTMYSDDSDNSACKPIHVMRTCPLGEGLVAATPSTDTECAACDGVTTFSDTTDGSTCKNIDNQRTCGLGQGFVAGSSTADSLCEVCDGVTRFSDHEDNSPCEAVNTGRVCAVGQGLVDSSASSDTSCVACDGITTFSAASENAPCRPINAARTCGPGQGFVAATASADTHCKACALGTEYSSMTDQSACQPVNKGRTCGLGFGFVAATRSSDTSCVACDGSSTYSDESGQGVCKAIDTARTCSAGHGFIAATSVSNTACESCVDGATFSATVDAQPCIAVDDCHLDLEQYESTAPTTSSDRFCSSLRQCNPVDQYVSKPATTTSDRECGYRQCLCSNGAPAHGATCPTHGSTKCLSCDAGFKFVGSHSQPACEACAQGTFRTATMKSESCSAFRTQASCPGGTEIDMAWGSARRDHRCTACSDGSFRPANYDGRCRAHSTSSAGKCASDHEIDLSTGTAQTDNVCVACQAGYYRSGSMASCALKKCTGCTNGTQATGIACTTHGGSACSSCNTGYFLRANKTCQAKKLCGPAQYMSNAGTGTSDRVCSSCVGDTYMSSTMHTFTSCHTKRKCGRGTYAITGTRSSNRRCEPCSKQGNDKYQDANLHTYTTCKERKECGPGQYMSSNGNWQTNRVCSTCQGGRYRSSPSQHRYTNCNAKSLCGKGTYAKSQGSTTSNRLCSTCTGDTYQSSHRHVRSSCYARKKCGAGQRTSFQGSIFANRACASCSNGQFQTSTAHTSTSCTAHKASEDCGENQEIQGDGDRTQDHTCGACAAHHYRTGSMSTCEEVQCTCEHGTGASGADCSVHGNALCIDCDDGYDLVGGECKESITPGLSVALETELSTVKGLQFEIQASATGMFSLMSTTSTRGDKQCDGSATISHAKWSAFKADTSDACTLPNTGSMADRCSFYVDCLDKNIPCGPDGYAQSYGKFYCDKFVRQSYKTSYAATWRDDTLKCLQQELHDALDTTSQQLHTCGALETVAFNSHADCYTQSSASVCDICEHADGADDLWKIFTAVEMNAYENTKSYKPLFDVLRTCVTKTSTTQVRRCAKNIAIFSKNRLLDRAALDYLRGSGTSGIAYKVQQLLRYHGGDELMGTTYRSLKGLINQHWNKKTALQAMAIPGAVANAAVSLTDTLLDGVQDALDSFSENTEGYCRLGQGTFDVWAGLELGRPDWGIAYTLPNGADVGNCIKKIASNYFCGVIKKAGNTLGNLLDEAHNTYGLSTGIEIGTTPGVLLGCESNLCLPKLVRAVRRSASNLRSKLSGSNQEKANMQAATKSGTMSVAASETAVAGMTHSDQGDLMGDSGWTHELFVKVGAPETEIEFTASVESSSVTSFVTAISNELVDVMNDLFLENFNPPSPIDTVWSVMVAGIKKGVRAAMEAQAKACGALSFHATLTLDVTELEESGFELGFTCQKMGSYAAVNGAFPMLGAIGAFSSSQQSQLDTCVAEEGPVEFSFTFAKFWGIADFVPGINIVADTYVFGLEASFDNWLESMTNDQKAIASTCAPPSSQLTLFKMAKALWIKIGETGLATIEAMIKAIKTIWKVLTDKQNTISNPSGSDLLPSRRLVEAPASVSSALVSPRRLHEEIAASSGKICVSPMARIAIGLAESAAKAVKALFDDICSSDDTSMVETKTQGSCTIPIKSAEACADAAVALGMSDTSVSDDNQDGVTYDPRGCYFESGSLKFNSQMTNTGSCTTTDKCLCQKNLCRRPSIKELWRAVRAILDQAYEAAKALYNGIVAEAGHAFDKLKDMVSDAFNNAKSDLVEIVKALYDRLKAKHNAAKSNLIKMFKLLRSAGLSVVQSIKELYNDLVSTGKASLTNLYKAVKDQVGETCELIENFQEADVPKNKLVDLGSTISAGLCSLECTKTITIPSGMPLIGGQDICTGFKMDICKETKSTGSFTYPSCECDSKEVCASIPVPGISDPEICMDVKMPLTCDCCETWSTYKPCKYFNLWPNWLDGNYCAPIGVSYCSQLMTATWGPKTYCSKFW